MYAATLDKGLGEITKQLLLRPVVVTSLEYVHHPAGQVDAPQLAVGLLQKHTQPLAVFLSLGCLCKQLVCTLRDFEQDRRSAAGLEQA